MVIDLELEKFTIMNCEKCKNMSFTVKFGLYKEDPCIQFTCNECGYVHYFTLDTLKLIMLMNKLKRS